MTAASDPSSNTNFTVFIRLPFPRGDFVDPPLVEWNASKNQELWDILSRPSKDDLDFSRAQKFDVSLQFLLQQAAWLYDRQLSQVRAQMRKVGTTQSNPPSPAPGSVSGSAALGGTVQKTTAPPTTRGHTRQVSLPKETPHPAARDRRTSSTSITTINQFRGSRDASRTDTPTAEGREQLRGSFGRRPSVTKREQPPSTTLLQSPPLEEEDLSSSSEDSDSDEDTSRRVPRFRRFGDLSMHRPGLRDDEEDDEDETPAFVPLSREAEQAPRDRTSQELNATLRLDAERAAAARRRVAGRSGSRAPVASESSMSSMSSGGPGNIPREDRRGSQTASPLSPRRAAETSLASPHKSQAPGREASDGTPSMGSSFSDLDDASVTQSALEEALMSNMQHGGMASRMSTISQALRSRYLQ
ncbi:hypothetical protein N7492_007616 [Penicillium capsulatum]|uniref:Autophagy-related protein 29 n=1 Tax=Penicillium capsulatum TaxID=69766 RepID=A0A9W9I083_9EURO|nr:hypothetical protein N7492_007616 [Penicillium capsulatum]